MVPRGDEAGEAEEARRAIEEAVHLLTEYLSISEMDATERLEAFARETRRTLAEVSESLILGEKLLKKGRRSKRRRAKKGKPS